jgi:WD40 repeat protein
MSIRFVALVLLLFVPPSSAAEPRLDPFGDPLPPGAVARLGSTRFRHSGKIVAATFSPDGKRIISASAHDDLRVWDRATGKLLRTAPFTKEAAMGLGLRVESEFGVDSPDGKIHVDNDYGMIRLIDSVTKPDVARIPLPSSFGVAAAFAPDGGVLAIASPERFILFDMIRNEIRHFVQLTLPGPFVRKASNDLDGPKAVLAFAPDGRNVALAFRNNGAVRVWDVASGEEVCRLRETGERCRSLVFAPDGKTLGWTHEKGFSLADISTGREFQSWKGEGTEHLQFAPDGRTLLSVDDNQLRLWDPSTGTGVLPVASPHPYLQSPVFSPDGAIVATRDYDNGVIRFWDAQTGKERHQLAQDDWVTVGDLVFSADGKSLVTKAWRRDGEMGRAITVWNTGTGRLLRVYDQNIGRLWALSPDGKTVATLQSSGSVLVCDLATGEERYRLPGKPITLIPGNPMNTFYVGFEALAFATDCESFLWACNDQKLRIWHTTTGEQLHESPMPSGGHGALAEGGRLLASFENEQVSVHDTRTGNLLMQFEKKGVFALHFSPDARTLAIIELGEHLQLFEVATGQERMRINGTILSFEIAFSPDGRRLATKMRDGTVLIWDLAAVAENRERK